MTGAAEVVLLGRPGRSLTAEELAAVANREHEACRDAVVSALEHAIAAGDALLKAHEAIAGTQGWEEWLSSHFTATSRTAHRYMRLATYREHLGSEMPVRQAFDSIAHLPRLIVVAGRPWSVPDEVRAEAVNLAGQGMTRKRIAEILEVSESSVSNWVNDAAGPERLKAQKERARQRRARHREMRDALRQRQVDQAVKRHGGTVAESYSLIRRTAQAVDRAATATDSREVRGALNAALRKLHAAEAEIVRALGIA